MKQSLIQIRLLAFTVLASLPLLGQGNVNFANAGVGMNSPFIFNGTRLGAGTYTLELLAGPDAGSLVLAAPAWMGGFANGYFNAGQRFIGNVIGNTAVAIARIWDNRGGTITSLDQAMATPGVLFGYSASPVVINLSLPPATPATLPPGLFLMVPEPTVLVLGLLGGLGSLLFSRRRE